MPIKNSDDHDGDFPHDDDVVHPAAATPSRSAFDSTYEENDDDDAPPPPEIIAASFEDVVDKPRPIDDDISDAPDPGGRIDVPLIGHDSEEEPRGRWGGGEGAEDDEMAPAPPEMTIAAYFGGDSHEEEKREEGHDDHEAPRPPEMIAAFYGEIDNVDRKAKEKKLEYHIEDDVTSIVREERTASAHEAVDKNVGITKRDIGRLREINDDETPAPTMNNRRNLPDRSSDRPHYYTAATNVHDRGFSFDPTHRDSDETSWNVRNRDHAGISGLITDELLSPPPLYVDPNNHSVPILEGKLVQDEPEEPVYDAYPLSDTQDNGVPYWSVKGCRIAICSLILVTFATIITLVRLSVNAAGRKEPSRPPVKNVTTITGMPATITGTVTPTAAPIWEPQGPPVVGNGEDDRLGWSVALSGNAGAMVIGAPGHNDDIGYVEVYHRAGEDDGNWTRLGDAIHGYEAGDRLGYSVDITSDGTTMICGSPGFYADVDARPGYVRVFKLVSDGDNAESWEQIGQNITGEAKGDEFGTSVSISDNGTMIAVGACRNDGIKGEDSGQVRIYHLDEDGTNWEQIGADIDGDMAGDWFGYSVSLSANGTIVVIGTPDAGLNGTKTGQVKVYRIDRSGSSWEQLGDSIYGDNQLDRFGNSVDISSDGYTIAIGSPGYVGIPGYARVLSLKGSDNLGYGDWNWKQIGEDFPGEAVGDFFGASVSLSDDGKTLTVGGSRNSGINGDDSGHVRVYRMNNSESGRMQLGEDIEGDAAGDKSGYSVSLSGDGNTVVIGSPYYDDSDSGESVGQVRVFLVNGE